MAFGYADALVLEHINVHIHPGQFVAVVGPSGAGKSTLLKLVLGLLKPVRGEICVDGCAAGSGRTLRVGYVPQLETVDWNFPVTVEQVALMGATRHTRFWPAHSRATFRRLHEVLQQLEIEHLAQRHIRDISGGQQQRTFLARALMAHPDLLVLDEPTVGVDARTAEGVLHLLAHLNQSGMSILMATHDLNATAAHVPWVICLNRNVIAQGAPEDVFTEKTLNDTYHGDMVVIRNGGHLFVHERPHPHTRAEVLPKPVPGHVP